MREIEDVISLYVDSFGIALGEWFVIWRWTIIGYVLGKDSLHKDNWKKKKRHRSPASSLARVSHHGLSIAIHSRLWAIVHELYLSSFTDGFPGFDLFGYLSYCTCIHEVFDCTIYKLTAQYGKTCLKMINK